MSWGRGSVRLLGWSVSRYLPRYGYRSFIYTRDGRGVTEFGRPPSSRFAPAEEYEVIFNTNRSEWLVLKQCRRR